MCNKTTLVGVIDTVLAPKQPTVAVVLQFIHVCCLDHDLSPSQKVCTIQSSCNPEHLQRAGIFVRAYPISRSNSIVREFNSIRGTETGKIEK